MPDRPEDQIAIVESHQLSIFKEPALPLAVLEFNGYVTSDLYRKAVSALLHQSEKEEIGYWLINCSNGCSISTEDQEWTINEVVPKIAQELTLQQIAILEPQSIFTRINLINLFDKLSRISPIEIQFFEKETNARNWLTENTHLDF